MTTRIGFRITDQHIKLLQNAVVRWEDCEFGAPAIDCKRPYGNTSVYLDMVEILGLDVAAISKDELNKLHKETYTALQVFLEIGKLEEGFYVQDSYGKPWNKVE